MWVEDGFTTRQIAIILITFLCDFQPPPVELKPCDPKSMLKSPPPFQTQTFEGVNVGRGNGVPTVWVGDIYKEGNLVTTVGLTVWHINEYRHFEMPPGHSGHFHSGMQQHCQRFSFSGNLFYIICNVIYNFLTPGILMLQERGTSSGGLTLCLRTE